MAVVLISVLATVLAWATFLESHYGDKSGAARYAIYEVWWFAAMIAILGLNVLCSALVRLPWKRRHIGFLLTHAGILLLLVGCLLTNRSGINAILSVYEGQSEWRAFEDAQNLVLTVKSDGRSEPETITIPFTPGPFNWEDYQEKSFFPWSLARRDEGLVYDSGGIRLEVLDYYNDAKWISLPGAVIGVRSAQDSVDATPELVRLRLRSVDRLRAFEQLLIPRGPRFTFGMVRSEAEMKAFEDSRPQGPLGPEGQIVLHAAGQKYAISPEIFQKKPRQVLGSSGLDVELVDHRPGSRYVRLKIHGPEGSDDQAGQLALDADFPDVNVQDHRHGVFGAYWRESPSADDLSQASPSQLQRLQLIRLPRIDVVQGPDLNLYFREWLAPQLGAVRPLPSDHSEVMALKGPLAIGLSMVEFSPSSKPNVKPQPIAFDKDQRPSDKQRLVQLRLTVDGNAQTFWLQGSLESPEKLRGESFYRRTVEGKKRRVAAVMAYKELDLGFRVFLHEFKLKRDPGSRTESHFSSLIDFCDRHDEDKRLQENLLITMNVPANYVDPSTGSSYRLYQSGYLKQPLRPGDPQFEQRVAGREMRDRLNRSDFTVNFDPGRGLKYLGSLLICVGIVAIFYMRSYLSNLRSKSREAN